jgi:hypothetical protein
MFRRGQGFPGSEIKLLYSEPNRIASKERFFCRIGAYQRPLRRPPSTLSETPVI